MIKQITFIVTIVCASIGAGVFASRTRTIAEDNASKMIEYKSECKEALQAHLDTHVRSDKMVFDKLDELIMAINKLAIKNAQVSTELKLLKEDLTYIKGIVKP